MSHYKHLTLSEREKLMYFLAKGYSMRRIAKELGRSAYVSVQRPYQISSN